MGYYDGVYEYETENSSSDLIGKGMSIKEVIDGLGNLNIITGKDRINQSLEEILSTPLGSRFFSPGFGSRLYEVVSEPNDEVAKDLAVLFTRESIKNCEMRIDVISINSSITVDGRSLVIDINYKLKDSSSVDSFVYTLNKEVPSL